MPETAPFDLHPAGHPIALRRTGPSPPGRARRNRLCRFNGFLIGAFVLAACGSADERSRVPPKADDPDATAAWLEQIEVVEDHPDLERARKVFARVRDASGQYARLEVRDFSFGPAAIALASGVVLLSPAALDFAFRDASLGDGDACLAVVLAHELAHLKHGDFWHFRSLGGLSDPELEDLVRLDVRNRQVLEAKADQEGVLAAMAAGYDVAPLFEPDARFFAEWVESIPGRFAEDDPHYPTPAHREALVREQLRQVSRQVWLFDEGTRRLHAAERSVATGRTGEQAILHAQEEYLEVIAILERFREHFDGREVLSNLAVAHLRIAAGELARCEGTLVHRYYLRPVIDPNTLANRSVKRGADDAFGHCFERPRYRAAITEAIELLELAVDRDPRYRRARLNLAMAYLLSRRAASAREQASLLLAREPDDPRALDLDAVADLFAADQGSRRIDKQAVIADLHALHLRFPDDPAIAFNLASALSYDPVHGLDRALPIWRAFLRLEPQGPWAEIARGWVGEEQPTEGPARVGR